MTLAPAQDWHTKVSMKWILWDTSALIRVIQYQAEEIFIELKNLNVTNCYIHPVLLELLATKNEGDRLRRSALIANNLTTELAFTNDELRLARALQLQSSGLCQASPVDLYCGAVTMKYGGNVLLLTENIKDFPRPYFNREAYITVENDVGASSLALLSAKKEMLTH